MKKSLYAISIIFSAITLQSCPGSINQPQNVYNSRHGEAYILTLNDTLQIKYSDAKENQHISLLYPSDYLQQVSWFPEQEDSVKHAVDIHELHVRKETDNGEVVVIEGYNIFINDEPWNYNAFTDPADTIQEVINALGQVETIIIKKRPAPYKLEDVIEQLELNYPDYVHRFSDMETHHFNNWEVTMDKSKWPKIYLN